MVLTSDYEQGPEKEFCPTGQLAMYMKYLQTVDAPSHIKFTKYIDTEYNLRPVFGKMVGGFNGSVIRKLPNVNGNVEMRRDVDAILAVYSPEAKPGDTFTLQLGKFNFHTKIQNTNRWHFIHENKLPHFCCALLLEPTNLKVPKKWTTVYTYNIVLADEVRKRSRCQLHKIPGTDLVFYYGILRKIPGNTVSSTLYIVFPRTPERIIFDFMVRVCKKIKALKQRKDKLINDQSLI